MFAVYGVIISISHQLVKYFLKLFSIFLSVRHQSFV
ncbi:hypothetical protein 7t3_0154 [Salmonella phage 7t3]|nr:hypothetical protein 7t3_0154 [Salmonella phage 7t3]